MMSTEGYSSVLCITNGNFLVQPSSRPKESSSATLPDAEHFPFIIMMMIKGRETF